MSIRSLGIPLVRGFEERLSGLILLNYKPFWLGLKLGFTYFGYAGMVYDVIAGNTVSHLYTMAQLGLADIFELLGVPFFVWKGLGLVLEKVYSEYERKL